MANPEHLKILNQGVEVWNRWRKENQKIRPELNKADLQGINLKEVNFRGATLVWANLTNCKFNRAKLRGANLIKSDLSGAYFYKADLTEANLSYADLTEANLYRANLKLANIYRANLNKANLNKANLSEANLNNAILTKANLTRGNLYKASLVSTNFEGADISNSRVYGVSAWNLKTNEETTQLSLVITRENEPVITVDNLEVAQFMYLLLNNKRIRHVIDTITSKVVLILGRFTDERKAVLDAIRDVLRKRDYLPVIFDFDKPTSRDLTETISTLAHMARFIVADITDEKSIPQELQAIIPNLPSVPVQPLLLGLSTEYGMFEHFRRFPWVLPICRYDNAEELIQSIQTMVIAPAEEMVKTTVDLKPS